ncbi:hypothetical protein WJX81_006816 [Elliptochloris bilobata]|uniref:3-hydroxyisobutyrate dehydrogenase n=1 Tax=Elliptochloris bilobata TaxID=381761 RepID=A0AAW1SBP0_9CHLO
MDVTLAIDFPEEEPEDRLDEEAVQAGELLTLEQPAERFPLVVGMNIIARRSGVPGKDAERLLAWQAEEAQAHVAGVFLSGNSVSAKHAAIYLERRGATCFVKDLGSRNKTILDRPGLAPSVLQPQDRYAVQSGDVVKFGTVAAHLKLSPAAEAGGAAVGVSGGEGVANKEAAAARAGLGTPGAPAQEVCTAELPQTLADPMAGTQELWHPESAQAPNQPPPPAAGPKGAGAAPHAEQAAHPAGGGGGGLTAERQPILGVHMLADVLGSCDDDSVWNPDVPGPPSQPDVTSPKDGWKKKKPHGGTSGGSPAPLAAEAPAAATGGRGKGRPGKAPPEAASKAVASVEGAPGKQRSLRKPQHKQVRVLFSTCIDAAQRKALARTVTRLGGAVAPDGDESFTHFVTLAPVAGDKGRGLVKSKSMLIALAEGRPVVTDAWLTASSLSGAFVEAAPDHLLVDHAAERREGFTLLGAHERAQSGRLLEGATVLISPGLRSAERDGGAGLEALAGTRRCFACAATADAPKKVGFIGLGQMGSRMAKSLLHCGHDLLVFDTSTTKLRAFCMETGVNSAASPSAMAAEASIIFTMLPGPEHVREVYRGSSGVLAAEHGLRAALLVDCSTVGPLAARQVAAEVAKARLHRGAAPVPGCSVAAPTIVDAPVSGGTTGAAAATLSFMCGGERAAVTAAEPYLRLMGKRIHFCGGPGNGQAAKVCNNLALAGQMAATAEGLALGARLGLDPALLSGVFNASSARCWSSDSYNPAPGVMEGVPSARGYAGAFVAELMVKDLGLALAAARECGGWWHWRAFSTKLCKSVSWHAQALWF